MTTVARMQRPLEDSFLGRPVDDGGELASCLAAIDDVMRSAERETSWPRFINVLRARGPTLREQLQQLVARPDHESQGARPRRRPLAARLAEAGLDEEQRGLVDHAQRLIGQAGYEWHVLAERGLDRTPTTPQVGQHVIEGEKAAWMHAFATVLLCRVASGEASAEQPSTEFAVSLAVDSARDACAHWATALELDDEEAA